MWNIFSKKQMLTYVCTFEYFSEYMPAALGFSVVGRAEATVLFSDEPEFVRDAIVFLVPKGFLAYADDAAWDDEAAFLADGGAIVPIAVFARLVAASLALFSPFNLFRPFLTGFCPATGTNFEIAVGLAMLPGATSLEGRAGVGIPLMARKM